MKGCKDGGKTLILDHEEIFLGMVRSPEVAAAIRSQWQKMPGADSVSKFEVVKQVFNAVQKNVTNIKYGDNYYNLQKGECTFLMKARNERKTRRIQPDEMKSLYEAGKMPVCYEANLMEIVFAYVYPRLDVEVSRHMNHLLKSPFVVHPKTGKICVPIDPDTIDDFDPDDRDWAPTLRTLEKELNEYYASAGQPDAAEKGFKEYEKIPSMNRAVEVFEKILLRPIRDWRAAEGATEAAGGMDVEDM